MVYIFGTLFMFIIFTNVAKSVPNLGDEPQNETYY